MQDEFGDKLKIKNKSFLLRPDWTPGKMRSPDKVDGLRRIEEQATDVGIKFAIPEPGSISPAGSMPCLAAAKCAARQGGEAFRRMDDALFKAYFHDLRDISDDEVLVEIARESDLDMEQFEADFKGKIYEPSVLSEYQEAHDQFGISGIPTIIINDRWSIVGAVPLTEYRKAFEMILSGEAENRVAAT